MQAKTFEAIDDELKSDLNDADAVIVDHCVIHWVTEYVGEDTRIFSTGASSMGLDLIHNGVIGTQVNESALDEYDDIVSIWLEPGYGLVRAENAPDDSDTLPPDSVPDDPADRERSGKGAIRPVEDNLSYDTLRAVMAVVEGYEDAHPDYPISELDDYQRGRYEAFSAMRGVLSRWLDALRTEHRTASVDLDSGNKE